MSANNLSLTVRVMMIFITLIFFAVAMQISADLLISTMDTLSSLESALFALSTGAVGAFTLFLLFLQIKNINK